MQGRGRGNRDKGERAVWTEGGVARSTGKGNAAAWQTKIFVGCICIQYECVFTAVCVCACECVCLSLTFWHIYGSFHQPNPCAAFNNNNNNSSNKGNNKLRTHVAYVSLYSSLPPPFSIFGAQHKPNSWSDIYKYIAWLQQDFFSAVPSINSWASWRNQQLERDGKLMLNLAFFTRCVDKKALSGWSREAARRRLIVISMEITWLM